MSEAAKTAPHGWLILDKPRGLGSTQAVGAVKRNLREGGYPKVKVGHGGTLDPLAEGVLPIALGEATKLAGRMLDASKIYEFTIRFGEETETLDTEGEVTETSEIRPTSAAIVAVLGQFTGPIEQIPPKYSALKIDGRRAYDLARAGEEVEMKMRGVTIHALELTGSANSSTEIRLPVDHGRGALPPGPKAECAADAKVGEITLTANVSKGTYIRSLARDIARALGTFAHVTHLRRIKAGPFLESAAISLDRLNEIGKGARLEDVMLPLEAGLDDIPALSLGFEEAAAVRQGRILSGLPHDDGLYCATHRQVPVALVELENGTVNIVRGFNLPDVAE
ncbi:tRNA pseudouridine(55) synthase TruB [Sphingomonadaceae bacterium]|nr:tRNA pseudouridine(55) synthase TruB [Sphingomonadaceae bacterium]